MDDIEDLRTRAYFLWESEGRPDGRADEHWAEAQRQAAPSGEARGTPPLDETLDETLDGTLNAHSVKDVLDPKNIALLEQDILPKYLARRRWFASKNRSVESVSVITPAIALDDVALIAQIRVGTSGADELYALPLAVLWDDERDGNQAQARDMAIARVRDDQRTGILTDAFFVASFIRRLLAATADGDSIGSSATGKLDVLLEDGADEAIRACTDADFHWLSTEQSNSSVIVGGRIVLKLIRKLQHGIHPEAEMCRFLTRVGYRNASPLLAEIVMKQHDGAAISTFVFEGFVANEGDAWSCSIPTLRHAFASATDDSGASTEFDALTGDIGRRLGELHRTLSKAEGDPAFSPEAVEPADIDGWKADAIDQLRRAIDVLRQRDPQSADAEPGRRIVDLQDHIFGTIQRTDFSDSGSARTRIHGDFHLGQVLRATDDVFIIDFEGEPARPLASRRTKASPLRDVAGLLRSISYAVAFAAKEELADAATGDAGQWQRMESLRVSAEQAFMDAYRRESGITTETTDEVGVNLLTLFLIEKAAYEVCYEAANRPEWLPIAVHGLARMLAAFPGLERLDDASQ